MPGRGLTTVGDAVEEADDRDGLVALQDQCDERAGDRELAQRRIPRLVDVLGVVRIGLGGVDRALLERHERQALRLEAGQDLADQATADGVGLDQDEGALSHAESLSGHPGRAAWTVSPTAAYVVVVGPTGARTEAA